MADEKTCPHCGKPVPPTALGGICPECMLKAGLATQTEGPGGTGPHGTKVVLPLPKPEEIAPLFPQLEILECLGRGGMGVVYKARQPRLNRLVALKILAREREQDAQFAERFTREAQALARLNHPNIVTVYDFGTVGQASSLSPSNKEQATSETGATPILHYLLMEFVDGLNLRQLLQAGKMPSAQALTIVPKICEALQYAHEQNIVHRDIKPENILLDKSGRVKIADFGIAKMMGDEAGQQTLTGAKDAVGTPHYMAPEQIEKPLTVDHRADIYSLGVVFYEMLTGELPLGKFQPPSAKVQIDVRLDEVVLHALEKEPDRRYQQASQVKTAVETIVTTTSRTGGDESPQTESEKKRSQLASAAISPFRRGVRAGFLGFLLVVAAAVIITLLLPKVYVATAVVRLTGPEPPNPYHLQTEFEVIQSMAVLDPVAASLNLGQRWGKKSGGETFSDDQTASLMKGMIDLRPVRNTALIEIRFYSDSPKEAAEIANKIAETYCARPPGHTGEIIDRAIPPWRPFRPNVPLNLFMGVLAGLALGIFTGLAVGLTSFWRMRKASPPPVQKPDRFWRWFAVVVLALIAIVVGIEMIGLFAAIAIPNFVKARQHSQQAAAQQWTQQGWQLWQAQKLDEAAEKFQQAVQLAPDNADAWNGLGWATFNSGKSPEAEQAFQKAISLDPNQPGALNGLGQIYLSQGKYDLAEPYLLKAAPRATASWHGLTRLYLLEGKFDQAEKWAQNLIDAGQADDLARQMLQAAQAKHLSEGLRFRIEPQGVATASAASTLQFRLVLPEDSTEPADRLTSASGHDRFHLSRQVLLDDAAVARAGVDFNQTGRRVIEVRFTTAGAKEFEAITATNIGRQLAIVLRGQVLSAPVIQSVIPNGECQIDGSMSAGQISEIVDCLNRTATPTAEAWNFSPIHERILPFKPLPDALFGWLDLDSGMVLTNASLDWESRNGYEWIRTNGLDVVVTESAKHFPTLLGVDMLVAPAPTNGWDIVSAVDVVHNWALLQEEPQQKKVFGAMPGQTDTFFFQTSKGGKGILQILGFADNPHDLRIRYKLVQAANSQMASPLSTYKSADLREAKARLAELAIVYSPRSPVYLKQQAKIQALENEGKEHPDEPLDLREAQAELAELRVNYTESNPAIQRALARIKELERLTKEEPNDPADLREAKAHLAELRVDYAEQNPAIQEALAKIKALEQKDVTPVRTQE
jgi:serine/threonine protein kinase/tetratricopeptide (TPR) repeat protein